MDLAEVRRHIQIQAYNLEHFINYDPRKVFKEQSNHNKIKTKRKTIYDEPSDIEETDYVDESYKEIKKTSNSYENKNNVSYELNVEKDLYGIESETDPEIKALMKDTVVKKETPIIEKPKILTEKEQYLQNIEIARNSKKRKKLLSVIYE